MQVHMLMGYPASAKGSFVAKSFPGHRVLNRDTVGGTVAGLLPAFEAALAAGENVVLDNTFLTVESRKPFLDAAAQAGVSVTLHWMQTSLEDCQLNALHRMWDRYGQVFLTAADIKAHPQAKADPNIFPLVAMFAMKKRLLGDKKKDIPVGKPTMAEGFAGIIKVPFVRRKGAGTRSALLLDHDGTLRAGRDVHGGEQHYPLTREQVIALPGRRKRLEALGPEFDVIIGISNQSGVAKGHLTAAKAEELLRLTNTEVGLPHDAPVLFCPHGSFAGGCYCRKPQLGMAVQAIREHLLDPSRVVMVGDMKTDATFAERAGFQFEWAEDFFR